MTRRASVLTRRDTCAGDVPRSAGTRRAAATNTGGGKKRRLSFAASVLPERGRAEKNGGRTAAACGGRGIFAAVLYAAAARKAANAPAVSRAAARSQRRAAASRAGALVLLAAAFFCAGCSERREKRIVIWTDNSEFALYTEIFNERHETKAVLVYKADPAAALPPAGDEQPPDLVVGPWLRNEKTRRYFENLGYLFDRKYIFSAEFYPVLLDSGKIGRRQYLLPVSFNLPAVIFSAADEDRIEDKYMLTLEQLRREGAAYNQKNAAGAYTRIGFAPQADGGFLLTAVKMAGAEFHISRGDLCYDAVALSRATDWLSGWISEENSGAETESNFVYKYLSMPAHRQVTSGRTLFAYTASDRLFSLPSNQLSEIDFRWLQRDGLIPIEDSCVMAGIFRNAGNMAGASEFLSWFFEPETQAAILKRKAAMNLDTNRFGIAGGFSAIRGINEQELPAYYTTLLSNVPQAESLSAPGAYIPRWDDMTAEVILPYIRDVLRQGDGGDIVSVETRYSEWKEQRFN